MNAAVPFLLQGMTEQPLHWERWAVGAVAVAVALLGAATLTVRASPPRSRRPSNWPWAPRTMPAPPSLPIVPGATLFVPSRQVTSGWFESDMYTGPLILAAHPHPRWSGDLALAPET